MWCVSGQTAILATVLHIAVSGPAMIVSMLADMDGRRLVLPWLLTGLLWPVSWWVAGRISEAVFFFVLHRSAPLPWRAKLWRRFGRRPPRRRRAAYATRMLRIGRRVLHLIADPAPASQSAAADDRRAIPATPTHESEIIDEPATPLASVLGWALLATVGAMIMYWLSLPFAEDDTRMLARSPIYFAIATFLGILGVWILGSSLLFRSVAADPSGVEVSPLFGSSQHFSPTDSVILVHGRWPGLVFVQLLRTDGVTRRVACSRPGFDHLIACWAAAHGEAGLNGDARREADNHQAGEP
jgi:hypothetical protein